MKTLLFALLLLQACSFSEKTTRVYNVTYSNSSHVDTVTVSESKEGMIGLEKLRTTFVYSRADTVRRHSVEEQDFSSQNIVQFLPPVGGILNNTALLPPPKVRLPVKLGDSLFSEHTTSEKLIGYKKPIQGYNIVTEKLLNFPDFPKDSVWKITAVNNVDDTLEGTYYYSEEHGFVHFVYRFDTLTVTISLLEIEYLRKEP